jgi:peptidoglycan hydrolase-like protein with peptidoglycan-binding domain
MARLRPEPERIREIQRALVQAGYLHQEPTGTWDPPTRGAMQRFQQEHGYPTTGLPEAKSLMKLGLGPHPLPGDADPSAAARTSAGTSAPASSPAGPPPTHEQQ